MASRKPPPPLSPDDPGLQELRQIQETFAKALFRPLASGDRMQSRWVDGRPMAKVTAEFIRPNDRLSSFERLEIYNKVYWYRILDSMYDDFPAVRAIVGDSKFMRLITAFLTSFPSESYTLRDLGERFPAFIAAEPERTAPHTAMALEAARFEWAQVVAFDSEAKTPLALDAALGADPATLRIGLQLYVSLLALEWPMDDYVIAIHQRNRMQETSSNVQVEMAERAEIPKVRRPRPDRCWVAVHRQDCTLFYKRLEPAAFAILGALQAGKPLAEACDEGVAASPGEDLAGNIGKWFHDWAALGWLCAAN